MVRSGLLVVLDSNGLLLAQRNGGHLPLDNAGLALIEALAGAAPETAPSLIAELAGRYGSDADLDEVLDEAAAVDEPGPPLASLGGERCGEWSAAAAGIDPEARLSTSLPLVARTDGTRFLVHGPRRASPVALSADELAVLAEHRQPRLVSEVAEALPGNRLAGDPPALAHVRGRLAGAGLLHADSVRTVRNGSAQFAGGPNARFRSAMLDLTHRRDAELATRPPRDGRVPVHPVHERRYVLAPPLALGLIFEYAQAYRDGALTQWYDFVPDWLIRFSTVPSLAEQGPGVYLFSNYVWSSSRNRRVSKRVKALSPESITVHGGPDVPKYPGDRDRYFAEHPHVDVLVHGEGEATAVDLLEALGGRVAGRAGDLTDLGDVAGITFRPRPGGEPVTTTARDRLTDLDIIPSPYLSGAFDIYRGVPPYEACLETNRGCPYSCTFCDWGSATNSRIRRFDLDRVLAEVEWMGQAGVERIVMADANFGITDRDVVIAEKIAEVATRYGAPSGFITSYAKNTNRHVQKIVKVMVDAGVVTQGTMSIQSFDPTTLDVIRRSNIRTEKYDQLARNFREEQLPVYTELMLGLPGSTLDSLADDLQHVLSREVQIRAYATQVLPNAPMNDPEYREQWKLRTDEDGILVETSTYSREDRREMDRMVVAAQAAESYGLLRHVVRWAGHRLGRREIDLIEDLRRVSFAHRARFPAVAWVLEHFMSYNVAPGSWDAFYDEIGVLLDELYGLGQDPEWATVRAVQLAIVPDRGRAFPLQVELAQDYPAWFQDLLDARGQGLDPRQAVAPLSTYPPGAIHVDDPARVCEETVGVWRHTGDYHHWELESPVSRFQGALLP